MDKFENKIKQINEGLLETQNENLVEVHFDGIQDSILEAHFEEMNEAKNDLSDEEIKDLATKYIELKMKLKNEPQFNRKVDINRELKTFLKNNPDIRGKDDTAQGINIFYKDRKVAGIKPQYAKKKVNLSYKRLKNDAIKFYI
jgi:hypothetical protein